LTFRPTGAPHYGGHIERLIGTMMGRVHFYPGSTFANPNARQDNDPARFAAMTFREFECALGWEIAGRYNKQIHSALLRPPVALWREHEASLALRMPKDRMAFWVSFLPDAHRTLRPDGIWLHDIPYWSNALSGQVGRTKHNLLVKFDPRDVSRIFVQHPDGRFIEARARSLGFPAISLREWKQARKALGVKGRGRGTTSRSPRPRSRNANWSTRQSPRPPPRDERRTRQKILGRSGFRLHDWYRFTHTNRLGTHGAATRPDNPTI
jgi:putative transposase